MIELKENERIDWFRIVADLRGAGVTVKDMSQTLDIPRSTIHGWCNEISNPRVETGLRVIQFWADTCERPVDEVPRYDRYQPHQSYSAAVQ
ncbi:MAG: hypothetical protein CML06_21005 [Pseudomonadales bacterium]|uniref:hypothetical protein n=1 Tax=Alteromonas australica TaxID=589873 RepID=UPI000C95D65E|nr:hypothetical protein [Alteromonas australica]MAR93329.1 hypothetical protein [Pseudomonadales bacterium]